MRGALLDLIEEDGVTGALVVTTDGEVMACEVRHPLSGDQVSETACTFIRSARRSLGNDGAGNPEKLVLNTSCGHMTFVRMAGAYLVVVQDRERNIDFTIHSVD